jgi:hypothetical protein
MAYEFETEHEAHPEFEHELAGEFEEESEEESEHEHEAGLEGEGWLGAIGNVVGSLLGEEELESEHEHEHEFEEEQEHELGELNPIRKIYPDAMMEHLGELAAEAETEEEAAEHFLPLIGMAASKLLPVIAKAAAPLARKLLPKVARVVARATPRLTRGVGQIARTLHRTPQTRHLLKTVPAIARRTVGSLAHQAARGRVVTPRTAVRTLARQARTILGSPQRRLRTLRRHNHMERRFHRAYGPGMARPHWRWGRGRHMYGRYGQSGRLLAGAPGAVSRPGVRYGRMAGGRCVCPSCRTGGAAQYCRCCGQLLR